MTRRRWIADTATESTASLLGNEAEHLARVLRAQPGMEADIVANGRVYRGVITAVHAQEVAFALHGELPFERALPMTLALAVFKFDRMEWAIEKATELGVAAIVPILARRTEKHLAQSAEKRTERWRRIAHESAKQSRRAEIPIIEDPTPLSQYLQRETKAKRILLSEEERTISLHACIASAIDAAGNDLPEMIFAIGPEGGWTPDELKLFTQHHWQSASLGPRILRAETAAIATLAIASALL
jgi:16S rRNA (uracil1498-N3)-methyltransferase